MNKKFRKQTTNDIGRKNVKHIISANTKIIDTSDVKVFFLNTQLII